MDVFDYLKQYKEITFKEKHFNEVDALIIAAISYVPYDELGLSQKKTKALDIYKLIKSYKPPYDISARKMKYIDLLKRFCNAPRYKDVRFAFFKKERDKLSNKQFQAICIILSKNLYISFCGTDASTLGWKEDLNMSFLEIVPSEIEASKYANFIADKFWFKKIYLLGHSKGGRLAITAAKKLSKKKRLAAIYSFDAPNYPSSCYDKAYKEINPYINAYTPNESIIGRLMPEYRSKKIICSTAKLIKQHDLFTWKIDGHSFVYANAYTSKSTRIVNTINKTLTEQDDETKNLFVNTLYDIVDKAEIEKIPSKVEALPLLINKFPTIRKEWKNTSKEKRHIVKKIAFELIKDYIFGK